MLVVLDSNILLYALVTQPPYSEMAVLLLKDIETGKHEALLSVLAYGEVLGDRPNPSLLRAHTFIDALHHTMIIEVSQAIAKKAGQLRAAHPSLRLADAVHLSTSVLCHAEQFITNDLALAKTAKKITPTMTLSEWVKSGF